MKTDHRYAFSLTREELIEALQNYCANKDKQFPKVTDFEWNISGEYNHTLTDVGQTSEIKTINLNAVSKK